MLPGHVSQKHMNETVGTLGQLSRQGSDVIYQLTSCQPIFYTPDIVHVESYARSNFAIKVFDVVWSGVTGWFRMGWGPSDLTYLRSGSISGAELGAAMEQDLLRLRLITRCQGMFSELSLRLYCSRLEYEATLAIVRRLHHLLAGFFSDTNLDGDTVVDGPWGRRNEVIIRGLCKELLTAIGYEEIESLQWCLTAPSCAG